MKHLYEMHGGFSHATISPPLDIAGLERLHEAFHMDDYLCPPHEHEEGDVLEMGKVVFKYGKSYLKKIAKNIQEVRELEEDGK